MSAPEKEKARTLNHYVIKIEVLREDPFPEDYDLMDMVRDGIFGETSMSWGVSRHGQVGQERAAEICASHGTDPAFFGLEEEGPHG